MPASPPATAAACLLLLALLPAAPTLDGPRLLIRSGRFLHCVAAP